MRTKVGRNLFVAYLIFGICVPALAVIPLMNAQADTVTATITVGSNPQGVAINPAGTYAYVTNAGSNSVSKINLATNSVVATIAISAPDVSPHAIAINPAGTYAYVTNFYGTVSKINLATDTVVASITVSAGNIDDRLRPYS